MAVQGVTGNLLETLRNRDFPVLSCKPLLISRNSAKIVYRFIGHKT